MPDTQDNAFVLIGTIFLKLSKTLRYKTRMVSWETLVEDVERSGQDISKDLVKIFP